MGPAKITRGLINKPDILIAGILDPVYNAIIKFQTTFFGFVFFIFYHSQKSVKLTTYNCTHTCITLYHSNIGMHYTSAHFRLQYITIMSIF